MSSEVGNRLSPVHVWLLRPHLNMLLICLNKTYVVKQVSGGHVWAENQQIALLLLMEVLWLFHSHCGKFGLFVPHFVDISMSVKHRTHCWYFPILIVCVLLYQVSIDYHHCTPDKFIHAFISTSVNPSICIGQLYLLCVNWCAVFIFVFKFMFAVKPHAVLSGDFIQNKLMTFSWNCATIHYKQIQDWERT